MTKAFNPFRRRPAPQNQGRDWFIELSEDADIPPRRWLAFMAWITADPRNETDFARYESIANAITRLGSDSDFVVAACDEGQAARRRRDRGTGWRRLLLAAPAMAAACALVLVLAFHWLGPETFDTARGQQRAVPLPDGTLMTLNTDSAATVTFLPWRRTIDLTRGEAFFVVAHENNRPFFVTAGNGQIRSIGTKFGVRIQDGAVQVSLVDGTLLVQSGRASLSDPATQVQAMSSGEILRYDAGGRQQRVKDSDVTAINDWTRGRLNFTSMRLEDVVSELNRYSPKQIVIADSALRGQTISAYFNIGQLDGFLAVLDSWFDISHYNRDPRTIVLYRKPRSI